MVRMDHSGVRRTQSKRLHGSRLDRVKVICQNEWLWPRLLVVQSQLGWRCSRLRVCGRAYVWLTEEGARPFNLQPPFWALLLELLR